MRIERRVVASTFNLESGRVAYTVRTSVYDATDTLLREWTDELACSADDRALVAAHTAHFAKVDAPNFSPDVQLPDPLGAFDARATVAAVEFEKAALDRAALADAFAAQRAADQA